MDDMEQRYLRGQIGALNLIQRHLKEQSKIEGFNKEDDFFWVLDAAEREAEKGVKRLAGIPNWRDRLLDWSEEILQWLFEGGTPDYKSYLAQMNSIKSLKEKVVYTKEEQNEINLWDDFFDAQKSNE